MTELNSGTVTLSLSVPIMRSFSVLGILVVCAIPTLFGPVKQSDFSAMCLRRRVGMVLGRPRDTAMDFHDLEFPLEAAIQGMPDDHGTRVTWQRASYLKDVKGDRSVQMPLFKEIHPNDIGQGAAGNCGFIAALAALAEYPEEVEHLFPEAERARDPKATETGRYVVRHRGGRVRAV